MNYGWDPGKRAANVAKHGVDFAGVEVFEWSTSVVEADVRFHYGEVRLVATGGINGRLHGLVYTIRRTTTWIISLRKASNKEIKRYASEG